ncbi:MAG: hypothetical protein ACO1QB_10145, partial [Verrucomicrobiales bacterium]
MKKQRISAKIAIIGLLASSVMAAQAQSGGGGGAGGGGAAGGGGGAAGSGATGSGSVGTTAAGGGAGSSGIVRGAGAAGGNAAAGARTGAAASSSTAVGGGIVAPGGLTGSSAVTGTGAEVDATGRAISGSGTGAAGTAINSGITAGRAGSGAVGTATTSPFANGAAGTGFGAGAGGVGVSGNVAANPAGTSVPFVALPGAVQAALRTQAGNGAGAAAVTQVMTPNGPVYTTTVPGPGNTTRQLQISPTGAILANNANIPNSPLGNTALPLPGAGVSVPGDRNPLARQDGATGTGAIGTGLGATGVGVNGAALGAGVGTLNGGTALTGGVVGSGYAVPTAVVFDDLPENLRKGVQTQIGDGAVTAVTRQMTPNGPAYNVIYNNDGQPANLMVDENGRPVTAARLAGRGTNSVQQVEMDDLPPEVVTALKGQAPYAEIRFINKESRATGDAYTIGFRSDDRYTEMEIGSDGKILQDSRNIPIVTVAKEISAEPESKMTLASTPKVIQDAVKAYAGPSDVRNVQLTTKDGKTAFDVVFYRDGRRDQVILSKDGSVLEYREDVPPAAEAASTEAPVIAIGDLPEQVGETIRRQTDGVNVREITTRK